MDDYLGDDSSSGKPAVPERRPANEEKRDRDGQSAPVPVSVVDVKPEMLDWGLPSWETADSKAGSAAAIRLNGSAAGSELDAALPEEAAIQNPQPDSGAPDGAPALAFAVRMFESDPQQASSPKTLSSGAPGGVSNKAVQASTSLNTSSESLAETVSDQAAKPPAPPEPAGPDDSQLVLAAAKAALLNTDERRNAGGHAGQPDANNAPADALPAPADRGGTAGATAETRETAATRPVEPEPPPAPPVSHDVSLRLGDGQNNVDIRMTERAGEIRVMVHTADGNLANSMRNELPDLVGKLRQTGYQAETWRPAAPPQTDGERRSGSDSSPQQDSAGARKDGRQQQQQQQQQNQPRWVGEWNMSLNPAQESSI